jgi:leader peptidase (prepilin peptidase) / N-methyltransferase
LSETYQIIYMLFVFAFGLSFGSFLNVVIYRLPRKLSLSHPPSRCPSCEVRLGVIELIPLIGYLILRGRCRHCNAVISMRYPVVELLTGLLFLLLFNLFGLNLNFLFYLVLLYLLLAIALIDLEHRIVPNTLVAAGLIAASLLFLPQLFALWLPVNSEFIVDRAFLDGLAGLSLGGGVMLIIFLVSRGGMGAGDLKLMAMIGLYVGLRGAVLVMLLGFFLGALVGVAGMIFGKLTRKDALPFAPYLVMATLLEVLWGETIWNWYMNLLQ